MNNSNGFIIKLVNANFAKGSIGSFYKERGNGVTPNIADAHVFSKEAAMTIYEEAKHVLFEAVIPNQSTPTINNTEGFIIKVNNSNFANNVVGLYFKDFGQGTTPNLSDAHVYTEAQLVGLYDHNKHMLIQVN